MTTSGSGGGGDCNPCKPCEPCDAFETKCDQWHGLTGQSADEADLLEEGGNNNSRSIAAGSRSSTYTTGQDTRGGSTSGYYAGQHPRYLDYAASGSNGAAATHGAAVRAAAAAAHAADEESLSDEEIEVEFGHAATDAGDLKKGRQKSALGGRSKRSGNKCCALLCAAWWCQVCCCLIIAAIIAAAIATPIILRNRDQAAKAEEDGSGQTRDSPQAGGAGGGDGNFNLEAYTKDVYDKLQPVSGTEVFAEGTPQNRAIEWLLADAADHAEGKEGASVPRDVNDPRFLQRYALGVSYHSLGGDDWIMCEQSEEGCTEQLGTEDDKDGRKTRDMPWLSSEDECNWHSIKCDSSGMITKMSLGGSSGDDGVQGEIPNEIGEMTSLRSLDLANNVDIAGTIPESLSKTSLEELTLSNNQIKAPFPSSLYGKKTLQKINIEKNAFAGPLPDFGAIPNLLFVDASDNDFSGTIPSTIGSLSRLRMIDLGDNDLDGPLPKELAQADRLERIIVNDNNLQGTLSSDIVSLPRLTHLNVRNNRFDGDIPQEIGDMGNSWVEDGKRRKQFVHLDHNKFTGILPDSIGDIDGLTVLTLQGNQLNEKQLLPQAICDLETSSIDDAFSLDKIVSTCDQVDCRCSDACQCAEDSSNLKTTLEDVDYDGDGILDEDSTGTNPFSPDSDGDGASDKAEIAASTDPNNANDKPKNLQDSNGDGISDAVDAAQALDSDADGIVDSAEKALGLDPYSPDSDGDNASDADEVAAGTNPHNAKDKPKSLQDSNGNGISDAIEAALLAVDSDNDGASNLEEIASGTDPNNARDKPNNGNVISDAIDAAQALDSDADGLVDSTEKALGLNPYSPDSDNDGATDAEEVAAGTDPLDTSDKPKNLQDSNKDGISDAVDAALVADSDADGIVDSVEKVLGLNPNSPDTDGNGASDKEEVAAGTDPLDASDTPSFKDSNGNGISDATEAALAFDSDGDGIIDSVEKALDLNPYSPDSDSDGASDAEEIVAGTKPLDAKDKPKDLQDSNDNGTSDATEAALALDSDGDGIIDSKEKALGLNPYSPDSDGDNASDAEEIAAGTDPLDTSSTPPFLDSDGDDVSDTLLATLIKDKDGDGVVDSAEKALGTNPYSPDSDGNGASDAEELVAGTDPLDPKDMPVDLVDSNNDGISDATEKALAADSDKDGVVDTVEEVYKQTLASVSGNAVYVNGSPQYKAAKFVARSDPMGPRNPSHPLFLQRYALATFYYATEGDAWKQCSNNDDKNCDINGSRNAFLSEKHECQWAPITCQNSGKVASIDFGLYGNGLSGDIPPEIGLLDSLVRLNVPNNGITSIPATLADTEITELNVSSNQIKSFPSSLEGKNTLKRIHIDRNAFKAEPLPDFASMPNLNHIYAQHNGFIGTIDSDLRSLEQLRNVDLSHNGLDGTVPSELGQLKKLVRLDVSNNNLRGSLPTEVVSLPRLISLSVSDNMFQGTVPTDIGNMGSFWEEANSQRDKAIRLDGNYFSGPIPKTIANIEDLKDLSLHGAGNDFSGDIPQDVCDMPLDELSMYCPHLDCECSDACVCIDDLSIDTKIDNDSVGDSIVLVDSSAIAKEDGEDGTNNKNKDKNQKDKVIVVDDADNAANAEDLESESASVYKVLKSISGDPVDVYGTPQYVAARWIISSDPAGLRAGDDPRLAQRYALATFYFTTNSDNSWKQCYEDHEFCNLGEPFLSKDDECAWAGVTCNDNTRMVTGLKMLSNSLQGSINPELGSLSSLKLLDLSDNEIGSTIPSSLSETQLTELIVSENTIVGPFPESLYNKESIEHVCIDRNKFEGNMPDWASMPNLRHIYAFENNFVGTLDPTIGSLSQLRTIALNSNKLEGEIPLSFSELENLEIFEVANNNMEGYIPEGILALPRLLYLWLANNNFSGEVSSSIGDMGSAWAEDNIPRGKYIRLEGNHLSGQLPSSLGNIENLYLLTLHGNYFSGEMPQEVCDLPVAGSDVNNQYALFKITSNCANVDCSCSEVCKCIDTGGDDSNDWQLTHNP